MGQLVDTYLSTVWHSFLKEVAQGGDEHAIEQCVRQLPSRDDIHNQAAKHLIDAGRVDTAWQLYGATRCIALCETHPDFLISHHGLQVKLAKELPEKYLEMVGAAWIPREDALVRVYQGLHETPLEATVAHAMGSIAYRTFAVVPTAWIGDASSAVRFAAYARGFEDWMLSAMIARDIRMGEHRFPNIRYPYCLLALTDKPVLPRVRIRGAAKDDIAMADVLRRRLQRPWVFTKVPDVPSQAWNNLVELMMSMDSLPLLQSMLVRETVHCDGASIKHPFQHEIEY